MVAIDRLRERGLTQRAYWISGPSGTGKTTIAKLIADEVATEWSMFVTMVCNRLQLISHEDVGLAAPEVIPLVRVCCQQAREFYDAEKQGKWRMFVGTAIRALRRAVKSREGDHFQAAVGLQPQLMDFVPEIPDWAHDMHTRKGKAMDRGLDHFRTDGALMIPAPTDTDPYEEECYEMWATRDTRKANAKASKRAAKVPSLF